MFSLSNQQLGTYRLIRRIGGAGVGDVYLAEDERTDITRQVAIKTIRAEFDTYPEKDTTREAERLFRHEMQMVTQLDHPLILPLYDFGEEQIGDTMLTYTVTPFCPEGSLANWLQKREEKEPLSLEETAHFVGQAAQALHHAHTHELIHQDVKPANFLLNDRSNQALPDILLSDFGVAGMARATATASQSIRGTPVYIAPEQWNGQPVPATDQYALAIMAYLLLTRHYPFQGSREQMMHQHLDKQPQAPSTFNSAIPPALDAVLLQALQKDPGDRFASISACANAFRQAIRPTASPPRRPVLKPFSDEASPPRRSVLKPLSDEASPPQLPTAEAALPSPSSAAHPVPGLASAVSPTQETPTQPIAPVASSSTARTERDAPLSVSPATRAPVDTGAKPPTLPKWLVPSRSDIGSMFRSRTRVLITSGVLVVLILAGITGGVILPGRMNANQTAGGTQARTGALKSAWAARTFGTQILNGVAWLDAQFVAVGTSGTILISSNGNSWTAHDSGLAQPLYGVAWSDSQFVAVGANGTILTSPTGKTWITHKSGIAQSLHSVTWSGSQFVAVGDIGMVLTSPNGSAWTLHDSDVTQSLYGVTWSGSQFVAVGDIGTILTSP